MMLTVPTSRQRIFIKKSGRTSGQGRGRKFSQIELDQPSVSDEELLLRYRDEHRQEDFAELYRRYAGDLYRYLFRYLKDNEMAEDVLQETFLRVHAKCGLFRRGWQARPWLYTIAIRRAVDALRRSCRLPKSTIESTDEADRSDSLVELLANTDAGPLAMIMEQEERSWVKEILNGLPEPRRQVLELLYFNNLSYSEISLRLGIPLGTVKSRLHHAILHLRNRAGDSNIST